MFTILFVMNTIQFPRWAEVLGTSDLSQKDRESYRVKGFASRGSIQPRARSVLRGRRGRSTRM